MSPKLIVALVSVGLVAFCMAFFRTGKPDIPGLERPHVRLNAMLQINDDTAKPPAGTVQSRFKKTDTETKQTSPQRKKASATTKRKTDRLSRIKEARKKARLKRAANSGLDNGNENAISPNKDVRSKARGFRMPARNQALDDREERYSTRYLENGAEELDSPGIINEDAGLATDDVNNEQDADPETLMENLAVE